MLVLTVRLSYVLLSLCSVSAYVLLGDVGRGEARRAFFTVLSLIQGVGVAAGPVDRIESCGGSDAQRDPAWVREK